MKAIKRCGYIVNLRKKLFHSFFEKMMHELLMHVNLKKNQILAYLNWCFCNAIWPDILPKLFPEENISCPEVESVVTHCNNISVWNFLRMRTKDSQVLKCLCYSLFMVVWSARCLLSTKEQTASALYTLYTLHLYQEILI